MLKVVHRGRRVDIVWAEDARGRTFGKSYFDTLVGHAQAAFLASFKLLGDDGQLHNQTRFRNEGDGVWCFKVHSGERLAGGFAGGRIFAITHGFHKAGGRGKMPTTEKARCQRLLGEHKERHADEG